MTYYRPSEATVSASIYEIEYDTRIVPDETQLTEYVGVKVKISGKAEYWDPNDPYDNLHPLANAPIHLYVNGSKVAETTTTSNGRWTFWYTFNSKGTYTLKIKFPGMTR